MTKEKKLGFELSSFMDWAEKQMEGGPIQIERWDKEMLAEFADKADDPVKEYRLALERLLCAMLAAGYGHGLNAAHTLDDDDKRELDAAQKSLKPRKARLEGAVHGLLVHFGQFIHDDLANQRYEAVNRVSMSEDEIIFEAKDLLKGESDEAGSQDN